MIDKQKQEISELKAMVNALREALLCGFNSGTDHDLAKWESDVKLLMLQTPKQCLANVSADAVGDAMQSFRYEFEGARDTDSIEAFFDEIERKLREQAK